MKLYMNGRGMEPMTLMGDVGDTSQLSESQVAKALSTVIEAANTLQRVGGAQAVIVEDGLIVAVESLTTGKLMWCN